MPSRKKAIQDLTKLVCKAVARAGYHQARSPSCHAVTLTVPGLLSDAADLIVPEAETPVEKRADAVWEVMAYLSNDELDSYAHRAVVRCIGRQVTDFMLVEGTAEGRLVRLLWAFSQDQERELGDTTLVVHTPCSEFGVREGAIVSGPYHGIPLDLKLSTYLVKEVQLKTRSTKVTGLRRLLRGRGEHEAYKAFCILYAAAEWDRSIPFTSLLLPKPRFEDMKIEKLAAKIMAVPEPYNFIYRKLVPTYLTYSDFINLYGNPEGRGNLGIRARIRLINKTYMLPILE